MVALPLFHFLDSRPTSVGERDPVPGSVNIPFAELPARTYELPDRFETINVLHNHADAGLAVDWLNAQSRRARLVGTPPCGEAESEPVQGRLWSPNPFLAHVVQALLPGTAIDLGCGAGREAIFLASLGWRVIAVDHLPDAIERAQQFALRYSGVSERIEWRVLDLEHRFPAETELDLVLMLYFLDRSAVRKSIEHLAKGGSFVLETFTDVHRAKFGKPHSDSRVLNEGEGPLLVPGMDVISYSEEWRSNGRHTGQLFATLP